MNIVNNFRDHLFTEKSKPSKVTVKNYLSDIRKFIQWHEKTYTAPFHTSALSPEIINAFQSFLQKNAEGSVVATRSAKRYISSLRKFCRFLKDSGAIEANPFDSIVAVPKTPEDPWQIKAFKNSLVAQNASKLTIKNYLLDVQQFLSWLEKVTENSDVNTQQPFLSIDAMTINQYKERLLTEERFSPISINRKLSSLRRYMRWLEEQGLLEKQPVIQEAPMQVETSIPVIAPVIEEAPIPLTMLRQLQSEEQVSTPEKYSKFAPIRLIQKTHKAVSSAADVLIFNPIAESAETIQYTIWKKSGRKVFAPVKTFLGESIDKLPVAEETTVAIKTTTTINRLATKTLSIASNFITVRTQEKPYTVRNISKSFYAPLSISLTNLSWKQRLVHHLRHTRPEWYRRYHALPISHHIHVAVLVFAMAAAGVATYHAATDNGSTSSSAIASQPMAPPRTLSFQGRLLDKTNTPITAETNLRFAVYNSPSASGSALLWQEVQEVTPNQDGYFTALLGKKSSLSQSVFNNNPNLFVGIAVGSENELQPRQQLATGGLSANSQSLQGLKPITDTDKTENVILALDSSGDLTIGGSASPTFQATGGQFTIAGQTLLMTTNPGSNGNIALSPDGSGIVDMQAPLQNTTNNNTLGGVPGAVEVADLFAITTSSSSQSALTVRQNSIGDIISGFSNDIAKFRVDTIGNTMFAGNLQINGNTIGTNATTFGIANTNVVNLSIGENATTLSLGGRNGTTTINNTLEVKGSTNLTGPVNANDLITANGGIKVASGKNFTLTDFTPGAIPFIGISNQLTQDANSFAWEPIGKSFKVVGAVCVKAIAGACAGSAAGTIYAANATVQAADLAENYISSQQLEAGDVVIPESLGNNLAVVKSTDAYQPQVIGIISTKPGFTLNSDAKGDATHPNVYPLALQGRVPVKVTTSNGPIKSGDPLTSSNIPGVAMKATQPGQIIAKALESYENSDPNAVGKVMAFVNISYQIPQSKMTSSGDLNLAVNSGIPTTSQNGKTLADATTIASANGIIDSIKSNVIQATEISTQTLRVATGNVFIGDQSLSDYISGIVKEITGKTIANSDTTTGIINAMTLSASDSADLAIIEPGVTVTSAASKAQEASASGNVINEELEIATDEAQAAPIYNSIASAGARQTISLPTPTPIKSVQTPTLIVPTITPGVTASEEASIKNEVDALITSDTPKFMDTLQTPSELGLEKLDTQEATVSNTFAVLGRTTLSDVGITGKITAGLMSIDGLDDEGFASINTSSGPLKFQSNGFNGVDFMNGKVAIDPNGNIEVNGNAYFAKNVTVKGKLAANIIAPVPGSDLTVQNTSGKDVVKVSQNGDVTASGSGKFANINIVRGAQADTSVTETKANGSAGKGIIKAKQKERTIYTPYVTKYSLIYVTATSDTQKMTPYVARQTAQEDGKGSFTIQIPSNVSKDITFNWWIVN